MRSTSERRYKVITIIGDCPFMVETIVKGLDSAKEVAEKAKAILERRGVYGKAWLEEVKA